MMMIIVSIIYRSSQNMFVSDIKVLLGRLGARTLRAGGLRAVRAGGNHKSHAALVHRAALQSSYKHGRDRRRCVPPVA